MLHSLLDFRALIPNSHANIAAASYFVLEPLRISHEGTNVLTLDVVGDDLDEQEPSYYCIAVGFPDRPARRHAWETPDFIEAIIMLHEIREQRPDVSIYLVDDVDEWGLEILGNDMLFGLIEAMAGRESRYDPAEWKWLAEDAAGNCPPEGRDYSPFFASIAQALNDRQAVIAAAG